MRVSTAGGGASAFAVLLLQRLPKGRLLNLGAGSGCCLGNEAIVVNVDHVVPAESVGLYVVAEAARLPFRNEAFEGALLKDVVEHLVDPIGALAETWRVTKDGCGLIVEVPRAIPRAVWGDPTHIRGFTARAIVTSLEMSGWRPTRPQRMGGFPGAGRLGLLPFLHLIMRVPGIGHWFGTNWLVHAKRAPSSLLGTSNYGKS